MACTVVNPGRPTLLICPFFREVVARRPKWLDCSKADEADGSSGCYTGQGIVAAVERIRMVSPMRALGTGSALYYYIMYIRYGPGRRPKESGADGD